ncbi:UL36 very large tegument protein [Streptomyces sp. NPDC021012]|uniref:UL36 very large tegument protein n=1 Tax=Streptomyces sp. NPDC021012 TaxID=3365107 RepID=UPI00379168C1
MEVATFREWLTDLVGRGRPDGGWYGVFAARDPEGLRACLDGAEIPPWDVVESLLQDAGETTGGPFAAHGRILHAAAAGAHDRRPGGAEALAERRDLMESERRHAETRSRELTERLHTAPEPAQVARLEHELAWTRDDHARATARVRELTGRLARLGAEASRAAGRDSTAGAAGRVASGPVAVGPLIRAAGSLRAGTPTSGPAASAPPIRAAGPVAAGPVASGLPTRMAGPVASGPLIRTAGPVVAAPPIPAAGPPAGAVKSAKTRRRPRGARYAWLDEGAEEAGEVAVPVLPAGGAAPRGARFGGAAEAVAAVEAPPTDPAEAVRAAANAVYALRRLRAQGRSGEAHVLLCEALGGPPARLPALAEELHRAGLGADWSTLLWEAASLPPGRLAAVAGVLADAGRAADCERLLRQGVARPVEELAGACAALRAEDHHREEHALLTAFVRVRTAEDAARLAGEDPQGLVPRLLAAAREVSASRERDLLHALRVAGV